MLVDIFYPLTIDKCIHIIRQIQAGLYL